MQIGWTKMTRDAIPPYPKPEHLAEVLPLRPPVVANIDGQRVNLDRLDNEQLLELSEEARDRMGIARRELILIQEYRLTRSAEQRTHTRGLLRILFGRGES